MVAVSLGFAPTPAAATHDRCDVRNPTHSSSWGCHRIARGRSGSSVVVDDALHDGYCVELWSIDRFGARVGMYARSCGPPKWAWIPIGDSAGAGCGVRVYRTDGRYQTLAFC